MRKTLLFTARPGEASLARRITLAQAGLRERSDLQEWIRKNPQILGQGVRIVTYEFDRWISGSGSRADRLDLLGLDEEGHLVLAELKRDAAPDTVEMQAIKYAAYVSRFDRDTLAKHHGDYLRAAVDGELSDEEALAQLEDHCGGLDETRLRSPKIVLVAGSFPEPVTASVVWLHEQGINIALVQVEAFQAERDLVICVNQIWPLPQVEDFMVSPRSATPPGTTGTSERVPVRAVATLAQSGSLPDGTDLYLNPSGAHAEAVNTWVSDKPERGRAVWRTGERVRALEWLVDGERYSASGLANLIVKEATHHEVAVWGPDWWALDDGTTLAQLAGTSTSRRDWSQLHQALAALKAGEWTTYGDLASAVGSHAIAIGQHVARCDRCESPWRVLGADGRPRPNFTWADPGDTRTARQVLEAEGLSFTTAGTADPAHRVTGEQLKGRV